MPAKPERRREIRQRHAAKRKARDPVAEQFRERIKKRRQRMTARARYATGWAEHSRKCPVCASTIAVGSGDMPHISGRVRRQILRKVARSELGKAASVNYASGNDALTNQVRMYLQALCPDGQRLLLPLLSSAGQAAAPGTPSTSAGLLLDAADSQEELGAPYYARWAKREYLEDPIYLDAPATPEIAYEEWAWYEHRWPLERLAGMDEARRCLDRAEALSVAISQLPAEAQFVAQRIRRCGLLGAYEGWVYGRELLGGLAWPQQVRNGLGQLRRVGLLEVNPKPIQSMPDQSMKWYAIKSKEVIQKNEAA